MKRPQSVHVTVYRPNRNGKQARYWLLRYRNLQTGRFTDKSSRTSNKQAALRLAAQLQEHLARKQDPLNTPRVRIDQWFDPTRFENRLRRGLCRRERTIKMHLCRARRFSQWVGGQRLFFLDELMKGHIESFLTEERMRGLTPGSVKEALSTVRLGLNMALEDSLIHENPASGITVMIPDRSARIFSEFETHMMLARMKGEIGDFVSVVYFQGLRVGEGCHLRWGDVDFEKSFIRIRGRDERDGVKGWEPKSRAGTRVLPMRAKVREMLLRRYQEKENASPYVFHRLQRNLHPERQAQRRFQKECQRIGILSVEGKEPTLRDLRRTQLTELAHTLTPYELQVFAGHENPQTTSKYYVHLRSEDLGQRLAHLDGERLEEDLYVRGGSDSSAAAIRFS